VTYLPSVRAQILTRSAYNRPLDDSGTQFETWAQTVDRVVGHQHWLWKRAQGRSLGKAQLAELDELRQLMLDRRAVLAGRTLWLGGTDIVKRREAANFNCSFLTLRTVHDVVDLFWLLLNGCGVGFKPEPGQLSGFTRRIPLLEIKRTTRQEAGERDTNVESWDPETRVWTIGVGDSAESWAKSAGKLLSGKFPAEKLVLDFSELRPAGSRLKGYGWLCHGDAAISRAYEALFHLLNQRAGQLLRKMDIHDVANWLGTVLSNRRSAQISLCDYASPEWETFALAKKDYWQRGQPQREQSNNSLIFWEKPTRPELRRVFQLMLDGGGSEPGIVNGAEAARRAPWFVGLNPCGEILLADKGFCNLVSVDLAKFIDDPGGLQRCMYVMARANYRQTCVNLKDGVLQEAWHQNNQFLRLCGVSLSGQAARPDLSAYDKRVLRNIAVQGAYSMADELDLPRPKNITTGKPDGTVAKIMDTPEGMHKPNGKYIFNNVTFAKHDPLVQQLVAAGYHVRQHPSNDINVLVRLPAKFENVEFDVVNGQEVNLESALSQLRRYREMMDAYIEQNQSVTISYDPSEVEDIVDWLLDNWDHYVGVSFLFRNDPTKTAEDLGYPYLPQQIVTREVYEAYVKQLRSIDLEAETASAGAELEDDCSTGACPIR
jgi:adenosylcobalamin-dependent ribonucleoside-triphosphate reductase